MTVFWITLSIVFILGLGSRAFSHTRTLNIAGTDTLVSEPSKFFMLIIMAIMVAVAGLRNNIGDTYFYMHTYDIQHFKISIDFSKEFGFEILQALLQKISHDPQILIFSCALITNILIIWTLYKYSNLFELALFVYITSGTYLVTMNGVRQYLAASITFVATKYLIERDWKKYFLFVLIAATIHKSVLILLPAYFIVGKKAWRAQTFLVLGVGVLTMIGYNQLSGVIFGALENTQYGHYSEFTEGGASSLRVMVTAAPLILAYIGKERLERLKPGTSDVIINMSIIGLFFMIISTQNWIFARMAIYFNLYNIILVAWVVKLFEKKDQKVIYLIILCCYILFYFIENVLVLQVHYQSNYLLK